MVHNGSAWEQINGSCVVQILGICPDGARGAPPDPDVLICSTGRAWRLAINSTSLRACDGPEMVLVLPRMSLETYDGPVTVM